MGSTLVVGRFTVIVGHGLAKARLLLGAFREGRSSREIIRGLRRSASVVAQNFAREGNDSSNPIESGLNGNGASSCVTQPTTGDERDGILDFLAIFLKISSTSGKGEENWKAAKGPNRLDIPRMSSRSSSSRQDQMELNTFTSPVLR